MVKLPLSDSELGEAKTTALVKTDRFEAIRLCMHAGKVIPDHKAKGPITVQCLQGCLLFNVGEVESRMVPGDWVYLEKEQIHSVKAIENS